MSVGGSNDGLLQSWKEIAAYLNRDVRTAIRWEKERGLPVHRAQVDQRTQRVFAYTHELDAWMLGKEYAAPLQPSATSSVQPVTRSRARFHELLIAVGVLLLVFLVLGAAATRSLPTSKQLPLSTPLNLIRSDYSLGAPVGLITADINHDGRPDLVVADTTNREISVMFGEPDGTFGERRATKLDYIFYYFTLGDFNADGQIDVAVPQIGAGTVRLYLGDGSGTFQFASETDVGGGSNKGILSADFNGDGKLDIAVARPLRDGVTILLGRGDGTFDKRQEISTEQGPGCIGTADVNGDGALDLVVCDYRAGTGKSIDVIVGNGDGTFKAARHFACGGGPLYVAIADFDHDGKLDIATANFQDRVSILRGHGDGTFDAPQEFDAGRANTYVAALDYDQDGLLDLLVLGMHDDSLAYLRGRGDGSFESPQLIKTSRYPDMIAVGDFNSDGKVDLAVSATFDHKVNVFLNRSLIRNQSWRERLGSYFRRRASSQWPLRTSG